MKKILIAAGTTVLAMMQLAVAEMRVGIVGLDTSHSPAFAKIINKAEPGTVFEGMRVTVAHKYGSLDIHSSTNRYPKYIENFEKMGIKVVDTLGELLAECDVVLLETNDGRRHLEQALEIFKAGKPVFIDKPVTASLADAIAVFKAAEKYKVPMFSCSALRYTKNVQAARAGEYGKIFGVDAFSPAGRDPTHPGLFWYGIHGVEQLFTVMGTGCESVTCTYLPSVELVTGVWRDGRIGTMRGTRGGRFKPAYGCEAYTEKEGRISLGGYEGYAPMVEVIAKFFKTGEIPIPPEETIEICAFMEAAVESENNGGAPVKIADVMARAEKEAATKVP